MAEFKVKEGKIKIIKLTDSHYIEVDKFIMENDSTLKFENEVKDFYVKANFVQIGKKVLIDGSGKDSNDPGKDRHGDPGRSSSGSGRDGNNGGKGGNGSKGVNLTFEWNIFEIKQLQIKTDGGKGAKGGKGQRGGKGANADCDEKGEPGGDGGKGGKGGNGGNAGKIILNYKCVDINGNEIPNCSNFQIVTSSRGGKEGSGGRGGSRGRGGSSHNCGLWTMDGGRNGSSGENGDKGTKGRAQRAQIKKLVHGDR
ncbi:MAG TPA: hypothetical protein VK177_10280 [Flavobacteriales bacterium]|nr:hypothetical protein [Flavobacteriales bacterium]